MADLLQSQIKGSCLLALPEGLKDLMADISREVLRAQPENLYQFIADYLSALLVAREHLFIAARVCDDVCKNRCCAELEDELRGLSLSDEDVQESLKIITEYFSNGAVKEGSLLQKLVQKTNIAQSELPIVQEAVRRAFLRHQVNQTAPIESSSSGSELDETTRAAKHTLKIYKKVTEQPDVTYNCVAAKVQAAYRAYNVRRKRTHARSVTPSGKRTDTIDKVRFQVKQDKLVADLVETNKCAIKCSSESLAGSFVSLPTYKPYRIDQRSAITEQDEVCEKETEHANFDYVTNVNSRLPQEYEEYNVISDRETEDKKANKKTISFHNLPKVVVVDYDEGIDETDEIHYEFEKGDEDEIEEQLSDEEKVIDIAEEDYGDEIPTKDHFNKQSPSNKSLLDENDDQIEETEMQNSKHWISNDSSEITDDSVDDDVDRFDDRNDGQVDDTSSEISVSDEKDDDSKYIDKALEAATDDINLMVENKVDEGNDT